MRWKVPAAIVLLVVGVGAVVVAVTGWPGGSRASRAQYLTATAATTDVAQTVVADGSLTRATTYDLNFGVAPAVEDASGTGASGNGTWSVTEVKVAVGDTVKKGAVLATADTSSLARDLSAAKNSLKAAKTQKTIAKENLDAAVGTDARRQARIGYENAVSQYTQAQGQVADLEEQIARATIKAPADGTVDAVAAVKGADLLERTRDHPVERRARGHGGLHRERPPVAQDRPVGNRDGRCDRRHGPGQGDRHRTLAGELVERRLGQRRDLRRDDRADLAAGHGATRA